MRRWLPLGLLLPVVAVTLFVGTRSPAGPAGPAQRAARIAGEVRCPTCQGLSAAESEAPASQAIRKEIRRRVDAGESNGEVRAFLVDRYGPDIVLKPEATGLAALVWALPVAAFVCAAAGLVLAFNRWRRRSGPAVAATADDRVLVGRALHR